MTVQEIKQRFTIIGNSPSLTRAIATAQQVAPTDLTVLITGESGVGKEAFSQIIHQLSRRKLNPFIAVNCGAIPEGTIDSELFGHEKGSFTGAVDARKGYFETVNGGTIFLDEVGEMPLGTQARLLRVLETGEFIKVGSSKVQKTDVRLVAATNVDLTAAIQNGKFREDLYYRLNTVGILIPPLRERQEDVFLLFRKFASDFAEKYKSSPIILDEEAQRTLSAYAWPGNIRQLRNIAEQISVLESGRAVTAQTLSTYLPNLPKRNSLPAIAGQAKDGEYSERELLYKVLFDMKRDLTELKKLVGNIIQHTDLPLDTSFFNDGLFLPAARDGGQQMKEAEFGATEVQAHRTVAEMPEKRMAQEDDIVDVIEHHTLEEVERKMVTEALKRHRGRRREAAIELGISERTLYRKIKEYGLEE